MGSPELGASDRRAAALTLRGIAVFRDSGRVANESRARGTGDDLEESRAGPFRESDAPAGPIGETAMSGKRRRAR